MRFASARAFGNLPSIHHKMLSIIQLVIIHQPKTSHKFYNLDNIRKYIFAHLHSQNSLSQMVGLHIPSLNFRHNQIGSEVRAIVDNKHFVECFPRQPLCILKVFFYIIERWQYEEREELNGYWTKLSFGYDGAQNSIAFSEGIFDITSYSHKHK